LTEVLVWPTDILALPIFPLSPPLIKITCWGFKMQETISVARQGLGVYAPQNVL